jgi:hypothetical protein
VDLGLQFGLILRRPFAHEYVIHHQTIGPVRRRPTAQVARDGNWRERHTGRALHFIAVARLLASVAATTVEA